MQAPKAVIDLMKGVEHKSGGPAPPPEPRPLAVADQEVVELFVVRLRRSLDRRAGEATGQELNLARRRWCAFETAASRTSSGSPGSLRRLRGSLASLLEVDSRRHQDRDL
jgi:hypothetical protein